MTVRIAMWSGPRTISTAMMRSWSSRADCVVVDEPFYALYLDRSGRHHPGRDDVLAAQSRDPEVLLAALTSGPVPDGADIQYQKHMTHHVVPGLDVGRLEGLRHAFLIRDPDQLLASYARVRSSPQLEELGWAQQLELFRRFGGPVLDAADVLRDPAAAMTALCAALDVPYDPAMLSWPAGPQPTDGVWGQHWYAGVWDSTGFAPPAPPAAAAVPLHLRPLADSCRPYFGALARHKLRF